MMTEPNRQIGDYLLIRKIGAGGMAEVWMAEREQLGARKTVAIKLLNAVSAAKADHRQMFLAEARLTMLLNHSSIVSVFEVGEASGECFMAMEWVDGFNLAQLNETLWERGERLPIHVAVYVAVEVLRGLDHAHNVQIDGSASIVHRDVSPQNVMLSASGEVKLMDFGVARFSTEETAGIHVKGKLRYMPPEQLQGQSREPSVDLFAVGAILHEMLECQRFRDAESDVELLSKILSGEIPKLSNRDAIPPEVLRVLDGLLEPDPRQRLHSARAALRMLMQWPGYKNASIELEDHVARYRELCQDVALVGNSSGYSRQLPVQSKGYTTDSSARLLPPGINPSTATTYAQLADEAVDDTNVRSLQPRRRPRWRFNQIAAIVLLGLGVSLGVSSVGIALQSPAGEVAEAEEVEDAEDAEPDTEDRADAKPVEVAAVEPAPSADPPAPAPVAPTAAPEPEPEPVFEADPELEAEPELELEPEPPPPEPPEAEPERDDDDAAEDDATPKVRVALSAGNLYATQVRVGPRTLVLERNKNTFLPAGTHTVKVRPIGAKSKWTNVGKLKLRAGHQYEVEFARPASMRVREK